MKIHLKKKSNTGTRMPYRETKGQQAPDYFVGHQKQLNRRVLFEFIILQ
jgi:hypothetical protein